MDFQGTLGGLARSIESCCIDRELGIAIRCEPFLSSDVGLQGSVSDGDGACACPRFARRVGYICGDLKMEIRLITFRNGRVWFGRECDSE